MIPKCNVMFYYVLLLLMGVVLAACGPDNKTSPLAGAATVTAFSAAVQGSNTLTAGETGEVVVTLESSNAEEQFTITWSSSDSNVISISGTGSTVTFTAVGAGTATITATATASSDDTITTTNTGLITVNAANVAAVSGFDTSVTVPNTSTASYSEAVNCTSSDINVVTVISNGTQCVLTAVSAGTAVITASPVNGNGAPHTTTVTIAAAPSSDVTVTSNYSSPLAAGATSTASYSEAVNCTSSNSAVATVVSSGTSCTVTAVGEGTATITASPADGTGNAHTATITVTGGGTGGGTEGQGFLIVKLRPSGANLDIRDSNGNSLPNYPQVGAPTGTVALDQGTYNIIAYTDQNTERATISVNINEGGTTSVEITAPLEYYTGYGIVDSAKGGNLSFTPAVTGGLPPYVFEVQSHAGCLPSGLTFDGSTGTITGTISAMSSNLICTILVHDQQDEVADAATITFAAELDIDYDELDGDDESDTGMLSKDVITPVCNGVTYPQVLTAGLSAVEVTPSIIGASTSGSLSYSITPNLPAGLGFNSSTGVVSGTPVNAQSNAIYTITVQDSQLNTSDSYELNIEVLAGPDMSVTESHLIGTVGGYRSNGGRINNNIHIQGGAVGKYCFAWDEEPTNKDWSRPVQLIQAGYTDIEIDRNGDAIFDLNAETGIEQPVTEERTLYVYDDKGAYDQQTFTLELRNVPTLRYDEITHSITLGGLNTPPSAFSERLTAYTSHLEGQQQGYQPYLFFLDINDANIDTLLGGEGDTDPYTDLSSYGIPFTHPDGQVNYGRLQDDQSSNFDITNIRLKAGARPLGCYYRDTSDTPVEVDISTSLNESTGQFSLATSDLALEFGTGLLEEVDDDTNRRDDTDDIYQDLLKIVCTILILDDNGAWGMGDVPLTVYEALKLGYDTGRTELGDLDSDNESVEDDGVNENRYDLTLQRIVNNEYSLVIEDRSGSWLGNNITYSGPFEHPERNDERNILYDVDGGQDDPSVPLDAALGTSGKRSCVTTPESGQLPAGLQIKPDCSITGAPQEQGEFPGIQVRILDGNNSSVYAISPPFTLRVNPAISPFNYDVTEVDFDHTSTNNCRTIGGNSGLCSAVNDDIVDRGTQLTGGTAPFFFEPISIIMPNGTTLNMNDSTINSFPRGINIDDDPEIEIGIDYSNGGITFFEEHFEGLDPAVMSGTYQITMRATDINGATQTSTVVIPISGFTNDQDNDGIPDSVEDANGNGVVDAGETDPNNPDTDGDGLDDGVEDANQNGTQDAGETDPTNTDTDGDGTDDGQEVVNGTDPLDPNDPPPAQGLAIASTTCDANTNTGGVCNAQVDFNTLAGTTISSIQFDIDTQNGNFNPTGVSPIGPTLSTTPAWQFSVAGNTIVGAGPAITVVLDEPIVQIDLSRSGGGADVLSLSNALYGQVGSTNNNTVDTTGSETSVPAAAGGGGGGGGTPPPASPTTSFNADSSTCTSTSTNCDVQVQLGGLAAGEEISSLSFTVNAANGNFTVASATGVGPAAAWSFLSAGNIVTGIGDPITVTADTAIIRVTFNGSGGTDTLTLSNVTAGQPGSASSLTLETGGSLPIN